MFPFLVQKYYFPINQFHRKTRNFHFKLKFGTWTILNMQNSMMMYPFSILDPFLQVLLKKSVGILMLPD